MISSHMETEAGRSRAVGRERKRQVKVGKEPECTLEHLMLERESIFLCLVSYAVPCLLTLASSAILYHAEEKEREREKCEMQFFLLH
jgi:hypothetical protein